ncbi:MAG: c-type cytochrome [Bacteroidetes bacterium]|nr:c-type cytochrome [Bacteroidota bacterium]MBS1610540.1 c-type cytochrome [Bacteroidota bacterium]
MILSILSASVSVSHSFESCKKNHISAKRITGTPLKQEIPPGFPQPVYTFENNPLTEEGFILGRKLFYDGKLSKDGNFPCASCHQQYAAFATFDHPLSHGFDNRFSTRNAPAIFNEAWQKEFNLDGGVNNIEVQPLAPITAHNEMSETLENVISKISSDPSYTPLFKAAFGDNTINSQRLLKALAQFTVSLVSANSKYDKVKRGEASFLFYEQHGYELFQAHCTTCHPEPMFTDFSYRNTGLALDTSLKDYGRMKITNDPKDSLKFKVPSLRNVAVSSPYMHDGRFWYLSQCIRHYRDGIQKSVTLDSTLRNGIQLTEREIADINSFLRTLTDSSFLKNPRYADPEQKPIFSPDVH